MKLALQEYQLYQSSDIDFDEKEKHKSNLQKNFDSLKKINDIMLQEIKGMDKEEIEQEYILQVQDKFKVKTRLKISAFFWLSFYYLGTIYVSRSLKFTPLTRNLYLSFFIFPNLYYYYRQFQTMNGNLEEILIKHNISKYVIIKDQEMLDKFIDNYLSYHKTKKQL